MFTISNSATERVSGPLAREAAQRKPSMCTNHEQFEAMGEKWCVRYEDDPAPIKLSCPDVMAGYYKLEDSQRMLDADMQRRRNRFANRVAISNALDACTIPREGDD